ncbi:MAG: hypothetical protein GTN53_01025 [Candidatus Aminicenantes bacterium]|nr:hypothetical protein [Candidatus Aminicenantes bacterium]NIQ65797.1 hypothetical protein [Candidatus Aminicenantes bacterium]NIT21079.1 hypothetical protein [Candidatus Aminicenantes bacterium]
MQKIKLSEIQVSIKTLIGIFIAACTFVGSVFAAMNYYFTPRSEFNLVKQDVKWLRGFFEEMIDGAKARGMEKMKRAEIKEDR